MSMKLYYAPGACSFIPHVLLAMCGSPFEPVTGKLHRGEQHNEEYRRLNPRSQVPVLVHEGQVVTQIVAIALYLDQLFPGQHFLPAEPLARARALSTLAWMNNTVHPTFTHVFMPQKFSDQPEAQVAIKQYAVGQFRALLGELQQLVMQKNEAGQRWLAGADFSPLDAYALTFSRWGTIAGITPEEHPALWAFVLQVAAEPAVARVIERERLQLNMGKPA